MEQRLYRLGLVAATVLLSLTSTIKLPGTSINLTVLAQAQTNQDRRNEALRLNLPPSVVSLVCARVPQGLKLLVGLVAMKMN